MTGSNGKNRGNSHSNELEGSKVVDCEHRHQLTCKSDVWQSRHDCTAGTYPLPSVKRDEEQFPSFDKSGLIMVLKLAENKKVSVDNHVIR